MAGCLAGLWILTIRGNQTKDTCPDVTSPKSRTNYLYSEAESPTYTLGQLHPQETLLGQRSSSPQNIFPLGAISNALVSIPPTGLRDRQVSSSSYW